MSDQRDEGNPGDPGQQWPPNPQQDGYPPQGDYGQQVPPADQPPDQQADDSGQRDAEAEAQPSEQFSQQDDQQHTSVFPPVGVDPGQPSYGAQAYRPESAQPGYGQQQGYGQP
ncbi:MAG: hypothetical protein M3070_13665, partial [Actinomycetota bacterium]|nr:hypothetical protein [Actinomycetota bacterium]